MLAPFCSLIKIAFFAQGGYTLPLPPFAMAFGHSDIGAPTSSSPSQFTKVNYTSADRGQLQSLKISIPIIRFKPPKDDSLPTVLCFQHCVSGLQAGGQLNFWERR